MRSQQSSGFPTLCYFASFANCELHPVTISKTKIFNGRPQKKKKKKILFTAHFVV